MSEAKAYTEEELAEIRETLAMEPDPSRADEHAIACNLLATIDERDRVIRKFEEAIAWALGEADDFPHRREGEGAYWWRTELRKRANTARSEG